MLGSNPDPPLAAWDGLVVWPHLVSGQYHPMADVSVSPRGHNEGQRHNSEMIAGWLQSWSQLCVCLTLSDVTIVSISAGTNYLNYLTIQIVGTK